MASAVSSASEWAVRSTLGVSCLGSVPALLLARYVALGKLLKLSVPQLPHV